MFNKKQTSSTSPINGSKQLKKDGEEEDDDDRELLNRALINFE